MNKYANKKIINVLFLFMLSFVINTGICFCQIYVSPEGKDSNPGTEENPLATLYAAQDLARTIREQKVTSTEPITINIASGTYCMYKPLELTEEDSGTENAPLIFKGDTSLSPVLSGGLELPPFEKVSDELWKVSIPEIVLYSGTIRQLFVNGKRATRARTPNGRNFFHTKGASESPLDTSEIANVKITTKRLDLTSDQLNSLKGISDEDLKNVIISVHHAWDRTRKYIQAKSTEDSAIYIIGEQMHRWNKLDNSSQFYFENSESFLDEPGEWFLRSSGDLFYIPRKGESIDQTKAIIPVAENLLVIKGDSNEKVQNIYFENLSYQFTRYIMPISGNENAQAAAPTEATIMLDNAENIKFKNIEISHTANNGIWFRTATQNCELRHSYLHDLGIGGVKIGGLRIPDNKALVTNNIIIDNNIIRSGGHEFPQGVGIIIFQSSDNTISHNDISDFKYSGVSVGWVWGYHYSPSKRNRIVYNHIHHLGWGQLSDMGGVYTLGSSEGTVILNNVIHDVYSYGYGGWGLYTDEGSTGIVLENNLVYNTKSAGFHQHYGKDNIIRNNIFAFGELYQLQCTRAEEHRSFDFVNNIVIFDEGVVLEGPWDKIDIQMNNNIYWNKIGNKYAFNDKSFTEWRKKTGHDANSIIVDPLFKDVKNNNFHFQNTSNANKINFKAFDYTKAGVYGSEAWKQKAQMSDELKLEFNEAVNNLMKK